MSALKRSQALNSLFQAPRTYLLPKDLVSSAPLRYVSIGKLHTIIGGISEIDNDTSLFAQLLYINPIQEFHHLPVSTTNESGLALAPHCIATLGFVLDGALRYTIRLLKADCLSD